MSDSLKPKDIFLQAIEIQSAAERLSYLEDVCRNDTRLRRQVEDLLFAHDEPESYLDQPLVQFGHELTREAAQAEDVQLVENPGSVIGHYKILQEIGQGGFGVVYMAEQLEPVRRQVALKIIKPGMDTREVIARFEAERQALALMDHPNIARVLDGGATQSGRPYFVMELVKGIPLTDFCDQNKLPTRDRLELFVNVCKSVQHAHQKGVIHRDLKPSNVMVTLHDGIPVPKVIDFGISKAISQRLTEKTLFTRYGQMVGTPQYMSPEQAELSGLDIDTRSDVYSLGVLLYELLTGTTPLTVERVSSAAMDEIRRVIREEEAEKPSIRISKLSSARSTPGDGHARQALASLPNTLSTELDWVAMRCLEKDRTRRYQTAGDLADDVSRYLRGDSVNACPPTFRYRCGKFVSRYKTPVTVAASFLFVLVTSSALAWVLFLSARTARNDALRASAKETAARKEAELAREEAEQKHRQLAHYLYGSHISAAFQANISSDLATMRSRLAECAEGQRGWEWHRLNCLAQSRRVLLLDGPQTTFVAASPTRPEVAVTDTDSDLRLHNLDGGRLLWRKHIDVPDAKPLFSSDGNTIVVFTAFLSTLERFRFRTVGFDQPATIIVLDAITGRQIFREEWTGGPRLTAPAISPDGRFLIVGRSTFNTKAGQQRLATRAIDGSVELVDLRDENRVLWKAAAPGWPRCSFSPSSDRVFVVAMPGGGEGPSTVLCLRTSDGSTTWTHPHLGASVVQPSPIGQQLLLSETDGTLGAYDVYSGEFQKSYAGGTNSPVFWTSFSPDGKYALVSDMTGGVGLRDWRSQTEIQSFRLGEGVVAGTSEFTADSQHVIIKLDRAAPIELHDIIPLNFEFPIEGHTSAVKSVLFDPDGRMLTTVSMDGTLRRWDTSSGQERMIRAVHGQAYTLAISPDGSLFATGGDDGLKIWRSDSWKLLHFWRNTVPFWLTWTPDGSGILAGGGLDWVVRSWDVQSGSEMAASERIEGGIEGIAVLNNNRVAVMGRTGEIKLGDIRSLSFRELSSDRGIPSRCLAAHPGGNLMAAGLGSNIQLWDTENMQLVGTLEGHSTFVKALVFSPDGERLFSSDNDGWIRVWNHATKQVLMSFVGHQVPLAGNHGQMGVHAIAISNDGKTLATGGSDHLVKLWETTRPTPELSERRRVVLTAVQALTHLYSAAESPKDVLELLAKDDKLTRGELTTAMDIAESRGDWFPKAN